VDSKGDKVILISKRTHPPEVYELPLGPPTKAGIQTAKMIGKTMVKSVDSIIPFRDQPVGLDITTDNSLAAVVTYYGVFLFPRQADESWATAFSRVPTSLHPHHLGQAESIAFSKDGKTIYVVSEGKNSPIKRYKR
jgi:DNA-binding beta-propeller fold protein YncE